jgi:hypothetical protein
MVDQLARLMDAINPMSGEVKTCQFFSFVFLIDQILNALIIHCFKS